MNFNRKGFTLIESLFAFSVFISVIVLLVSLYTLNGKTMLRIEKEYQEYISIQSNQEQKLNLEEGIEQCLKRLYINRSFIKSFNYVLDCH